MPKLEVRVETFRGTDDKNDKIVLLCTDGETIAMLQQADAISHTDAEGYADWLRLKLGIMPHWRVTLESAVPPFQHWEAVIPAKDGQTAINRLIAAKKIVGDLQKVIAVQVSFGNEVPE